jgi:D-glycero-D-manno-heptose 1,7-bisphosphate phosphatase
MTQRTTAAFVDASGIWVEIRIEPALARQRPALFLDRDGVIVDEVGFLSRADDVRLRPGAASLIAAANRRRVPVVVVSNQSGIGRRYYGWADFQAVQARIELLLAAAGAHVDAVLACPFHADAPPPYDHPDHPDRKPRPGMLLRAARVLTLDMATSWIVGDRATDIMAGRNAGLAGGVLVVEAGVDTGDSERRNASAAAVDGVYTVMFVASAEAIPARLPLFGKADAL